MARKIKGIDTSKESNLKLEKDLTPTPLKIKRYITSEGFWIVLCFFYAVPFVVPSAAFAAEFVLILLLLAGILNIKSEETLPYKKRESSGDAYDLNEENPANNKPDDPQGITFFGNEIGTRKEVWFTNSDVRTHCLIFGTTGSGKTEALLSICVNTLNQASGLIYIDGKGDNSLWAKVFSLVAARGRLDDLYLINYMTSSIDLDNKSTEKISNTMNPFATGNADSLTELIVSLLPDGGGDGMWKGRAAVFMGALLRALVYLRNQGQLLLDIDTVRKYFTMKTIIELSERDDIPLKYLDGLQQYVINLPGYINPTSSNPNPEQPDTVNEQHGYITMQYTETFGLLADTYGHIMKTQVAEVDFYDIVVNRRILVVLLPALEKSTQNLGNLGRIIIASIKNMMSTTLGSKVEGDREEVIDTKPTNAPSPYMTIFDEYGYYAVEGAAVMPAQARSLGFFMIFAGQDFQAFKKGSEEESYSIVANCAIKICMKLEDPGETLKIFQDAAGEDNSVELSGFERDTQSTSSSSYSASNNVSVQKKNIINVRDLRDQNPGESHILFRDTVKRIKHYYANPKLLAATRVNTFLEVEPPSYEIVKELKFGHKKIEKQFLSILEDKKTYQKTVKKAIDAIGSPELANLFKFVKISRGTSNTIKTAFSVASYAERVNIIDNEIVTQIRENLEDFNTNLNQQDIEDDTNLKSTNKPNDESLKDDIDNVLTEVDGTEYSITMSLKEEVDKKQTELQQLEEDTFVVFDKIGLDFFGIQEKMAEFENEVVDKLNRKGLITNEYKVNEEYSNVVTENSLLDLNIAAIPNKEKENNDKERNNEIKDIIDSIIIDDIKDY
jgi:intracellular multiplication protein IcmO